MQTKRLKLTQLEPNLGQIEGLPINPRQWTQGDVDKIAKSLKETPELFEARPLLVIEHEGKYVILGGNLRYEGCKKNGAEDAPCYVFPKDTPIDKLKEIAIKDNGSFGAWDFDALRAEWSNEPLEDWGVPTWGQEKQSGAGDEDINDEDLPNAGAEVIAIRVEVPGEFADKIEDIKASIQATLDEWPGCKVK